MISSLCGQAAQLLHGHCYEGITRCIESRLLLAVFRSYIVRMHGMHLVLELQITDQRDKQLLWGVKMCGVDESVVVMNCSRWSLSMVEDS